MLTEMCRMKKPPVYLKFSDVAKAIGCSLPTARKWARKHGIVVNHNNMERVSVALIIERFGDTYAEILAEIEESKDESEA